jgi:hypothetical protein
MAVLDIQFPDDDSKNGWGEWIIEEHLAKEAKVAREKAEVERQAAAERKKAEKQHQTEIEAAKKERKDAIEAAKWHTWTDAEGTHHIEAKFGGVRSGNVKLTKRDGTALTMPLEKLSDEDQEWIKNRSK